MLNLRISFNDLNKSSLFIDNHGLVKQGSTTTAVVFSTDISLSFSVICSHEIHVLMLFSTSALQTLICFKDFPSSSNFIYRQAVQPLNRAVLQDHIVNANVNWQEAFGLVRISKSIMPKPSLCVVHLDCPTEYLHPILEELLFCEASVSTYHSKIQIFRPQSRATRRLPFL